MGLGAKPPAGVLGAEPPNGGVGGEAPNITIKNWSFQSHPKFWGNSSLNLNEYYLKLL